MMLRSSFLCWMSIGAIAFLIRCQTTNPQQLPESGAALFTWGAYFDTDLTVESFFGADHSVMVRFMPQYERSYEGPLFASVGAAGDPLYSVAVHVFPKFIGTKKIETPAILVRVGTDSATYEIPRPVPATPDYSGLTKAPTPATAMWRHLFAIRRAGMLEIWLDGDHLCRLGPVSCDVPVAAAPKGRIRLGKRAIDPTKETETQFYGLIDDLAVFDHALTPAELNGWYLTGADIGETTTGLRVGLNFDRPLPGDGAHIRPPSTLSGTARIVTVGAQHASGIDSPTLPIVNGTAPMELPFRGNETWEVLQEFSTEGSHADGAAFCWDFIYVPDSHPRGKPRLDGQAGDGRAFVAASDGTVVAVQQQFSTVTNPANFVVLQRSSDEFVSYLHLRQSSAFVNVNASVKRGDALGLVSNVGGGTPHLHIAVLNRPETLAGAPFTLLVTRPAYFVDYCASDDFGQSFTVVRIGMPRLGQWVRRMKVDGTCP